MVKLYLKENKILFFGYQKFFIQVTEMIANSNEKETLAIAEAVLNEAKNNFEFYRNGMGVNLNTIDAVATNDFSTGMITGMNNDQPRSSVEVPYNKQTYNAKDGSIQKLLDTFVQYGDMEQSASDAINSLLNSKNTKQYEDLSEELNQIRNKESIKYEKYCRPSLPSSNLDPFYIFSSYPSEIIDNDLTYYRSQNLNNLSIGSMLELDSVNYAKHYLPSKNDLELIYKSFDLDEGKNLTEVVKKTKLHEEVVFKSCIWLLKYGYLTSIGN